MKAEGKARTVVDLVLRLLVAAALATDAAVHIYLAPEYQLANPGGIGQGNLFYLESGAAILAALYVLTRGSRPAYFVAFLVVGSALAAVLVARYIGIPAIGPFPALFEPVWFFEKTLSAVAEGVGAALSIVGVLVTDREPRRR